eukprot:RCo020653
MSVIDLDAEECLACKPDPFMELPSLQDSRKRPLDTRPLNTITPSPKKRRKLDPGEVHAPTKGSTTPKRRRSSGAPEKPLPQIRATSSAGSDFDEDECASEADEGTALKDRRRR